VAIARPVPPSLAPVTSATRPSRLLPTASVLSAVTTNSATYDTRRACASGAGGGSAVVVRAVPESARPIDALRSARENMADKVAILTGGAGKMGGGICRALAKEGIVSAVFDLDISKAENAAKALVVDITDQDACAAAVDEVVRDLGGVDVLVQLAQAY